MKKYKGNIIVTGASGFIGNRFIEKCYFDYQLNPVGYFRDYKSAYNIARFPFKRLVGDLDVIKHSLLRSFEFNNNTKIYQVFSLIIKMKIIINIEFTFYL